jgi:NitT/TauT family transport system substrate-binding protein
MITRRDLLRGVTGAVGLLGWPPGHASGEPPPETTRLRVKKDPNLCEAPAQVAEALLRAEGFSEVQYVWALGPAATSEKMFAGEIDLALTTPLAAARRIEAGDPLVILAGVHVGCFELFGHKHVRTIRDLKGKMIAVAYLGGTAHLLTAIMAASVGLDPQQDITWAVRPGGREAMQFFIDGKADAFMGFPPEPQELRARKIGQVVVNTTKDRPWSQYFCCLIMATREFVRHHPVAAKRALRALFKANEVCALQPEMTAQLMVDRGYTNSYDLALKVLKEIPYGQWRQYDAEDTLRFFALRLREVGMLKATPQQLIARGTDWRFLNELRKELKG